MKVIKSLILFFLSAFLLTAGFQVVSALNDAETLKSEVLRFHIKANSDSEEDQALKLKVRDVVLKETSYLFENSESSIEAALIAEANKDTILEIAKKTISAEGYNYDVKIEIKNTYFPTKEYENFMRFPAGTYNAVNIYIGDALGQNWWCVLYPPVCLSCAVNKESITREILSPESDELIKSKTPKAKVKFKIVEEVNQLFEDIFK